MVELSLVMPMYNEEECVKQVVNEVKEYFDENDLDFELVIVNNGSKDKTGDILEEMHKEDSRVRVVHVVKNKGYGYGVRQGLKACVGRVIGYNDGDGQVKPKDILRVYEPIKEKKSGFSKAIRYNRGDGLKRIFASFFYNGIFHLLFLTRWRDINAKPKFFTQDFFKTLELESDDWFIDAEIMINVIHKSFKVHEVLVKFKERDGGKSNVRLNTVYEFLKNMLSWRFELWKKSLK
jgi:glycosyltransferase involved in cell wall biosynthesis